MEIGQKVEWQTTPKHIRRGKIVFVVPELQSPSWNMFMGKELRLFLDENLGRCGSALSDGGPRDHESYLVEVPSVDGKGKPKIYWPRVSQLTKIE